MHPLDVSALDMRIEEFEELSQTLVSGRESDERRLSRAFTTLSPTMMKFVHVSKNPGLGCTLVLLHVMSSLLLHIPLSWFLLTLFPLRWMHTLDKRFICRRQANMLKRLKRALL